jgi:IS605 OrfB family transposase
MRPNKQQRNVIDEWINTSRYVYNKTVNLIAEGHKINHFELRDKLVTENTKKNNPEYQLFMKELAVLQQQKKVTNNKAIDNLILLKKQSRHTIIKDLKTEKNEEVNQWELNTPKAVRDASVSDVCKAYKTGFSNLKAGNIKHFKLQFKKKTNPNKCVCVPKSLVTNKDGVIKLSSCFFKEDCNFKMGRKTIKKHKNLVIDNDIRIIKQKGIYWFVIPIPVSTNENNPLVNYCGVDPGVRSFMTTFGNNDCVEYKHDESQLKKINNKIANLKNLRCKKIINKRILKKKYNRLESKKENLINELHWKVINELLIRNDVIFYGDIKSHDIVKNGKNKTLNKNINDLKFYTFKTRLLSKAMEKHKRVVAVNEAFTSQTCSFCGMMYKPGISKVYKCKGCKSCVDRDINASKNILMKGIIKNL